MRIDNDIAHPSTLACQWPLGCDRVAAGYDHDHETDQVRAALCSMHNSGLGHVGDTPQALRAVADWLEQADLGFTFAEWIRQQSRLNNRRYYTDKPGYREYSVEYQRQRRIREAIA